jgi:hypothetical protein
MPHLIKVLSGFAAVTPSDGGDARVGLCDKA